MPEVKMASGRYEIEKTPVGEYTFSLFSTGGRLIAVGGNYKTLALAKKGHSEPADKFGSGRF